MAPRQRLLSPLSLQGWFFAFSYVPCTFLWSSCFPHPVISRHVANPVLALFREDIFWPVSRPSLLLCSRRWFISTCSSPRQVLYKVPALNPPHGVQDCIKIFTPRKDGGSSIIMLTPKLLHGETQTWVYATIKYASPEFSHSEFLKETQVRSLDQEDPLEKGMATHSSVLAWRIPWTEEPCGLQSTGSQRVRHNWAANTFTTYSSSSLCLAVSWLTFWSPRVVVFCSGTLLQQRMSWDMLSCCISQSLEFLGCTIPKEPACHCRKCKGHGSSPWVGKLLSRRACQPTPGFLSGESHGQRRLEGNSPWGCKSQTWLKQLSMHTRIQIFIFMILGNEGVS